MKYTEEFPIITNGSLKQVNKVGSTKDYIFCFLKQKDLLLTKRNLVFRHEAKIKTRQNISVFEVHVPVVQSNSLPQFFTHVKSSWQSCHQRSHSRRHIGTFTNFSRRIFMSTCTNDQYATSNQFVKS